MNKALDSNENDFIVALDNIESWTRNFLFPENQKMPEGDVIFGKLHPYLAKNATY